MEVLESRGWSHRGQFDEKYIDGENVENVIVLLSIDGRVGVAGYSSMDRACRESCLASRWPRCTGMMRLSSFWTVRLWKVIKV